jgi:hypothetical protein
MIKRTTTLVDFPDAPVPATAPQGLVMDLANGWARRGPVMTAVASVAAGAGFVIPQRIYADAADLPMMDLGALRHRGRAVTVSEWLPAVPGEPRIGTRLVPAFCGAPETVELTGYLPRVRDIAA